MLTTGRTNFRISSPARLGRLGEDLAARHLTAKGYSLIAKNYIIRGGEIDLIAKKNGILVFVEVKTRTNGNFGAAAEALTETKKRRMLRAIRTYLAAAPVYAPWRADLIAIDFTGPLTADLTHYQDVFQK